MRNQVRTGQVRKVEGWCSGGMNNSNSHFEILLRRLSDLAAVSRAEQKENEHTGITFDPFEATLCLLQSPVCG